MPKRLMARINTYQKDGKEKGKYIEVGVIMTSQHGEYALLHPHVDLSGLLIQQRLLDPQKAGKSVFCGIFDNDYRGNQDQPSQNQPDNGFDENLHF